VVVWLFEQAVTVTASIKIAISFFILFFLFFV
jgi:hypothetical protein